VLLAIVSALAIRPLLGDAGLGLVLFNLSLLVLLLMALFAMHIDELVGDRETLLAQRRRRMIVGWALALVAASERLYALFAPTPRLYLIGMVSWLLLFVFITSSQLRNLLKHKEVTGETISQSISIYLLLGLSWGSLYIVIWQLDPGAFNFGDSVTVAAAQSGHELQVFPVLIYFSLTTLSTIGFGDITPVSLQARYAAVAEGISGQLYLAILVARLVGMQMSRGQRPSSQ
jgi:hypothetical protein